MKEQFSNSAGQQVGEGKKITTKVGVQQFSFSLVVIVLLAAFAVPVFAQDSTGPKFETADCPFENRSEYVIDCGFVIAPEDHAHAENGRTVKLAVAIVRSPNAKKAADPVIYLAGGPGGAFVKTAPLLTFEIEVLLNNRDVVVFDQRGMGLSQPGLSCPLQNLLAVLTTDSSTPAFTNVLRDAGGLGACQARLKAAGIDTTLYNTVQNALDIGSIRQALNYEQVNLYGISWGTRLGLVALRENVPGIRSAVLDSVLPPDVNSFEAAPYVFDHAFTELEKGCQADPVCHIAYPNLRQMYVDTYEKLAKEPAPVNINGVPLVLTADIFAGQVSGALTFRDALQTAPGFIANVAGQNYEDVQKQMQSIQDGIAQGKTLDQGAFMTMACPEQMANTTLERIQAEEAKYPPAFRRPNLFFGLGGYYACQAWGDGKTVPAAPADSDVPTLLLAGQYDPLTPPEWARHAAETLAHGYVYELPGVGHVTTRDVCARRLVYNFLNDPTTAPDSTCIGDMKPLNFVLSIAATRPAVQGVAVLLSGLALYLLATAGLAFGRHPRQVAWRINAKMTGWIPIAITVVLMLLFINDKNSTIMPGPAINAIQTVIPLAMSIQAALVFAADEEPGLEMLLALPRSITWMVVERLALVMMTQTAIALIGAGLILAQKPDQDVMVLLVSWFPPALFLSGLALFVTLRSRVMMFGALMAGVLWFIFALFGDFFLPGTPWPFPLNLVQPFLWALHVHAVPGDFALMRDYWLNRLFLSLAGMWFIWRGLREVKDEEYLLMSASDKQRRRSAKVSTATPVIGGNKLKLDAVVHAVDTVINPLHQIAGMAWYEFKMHWQRRAIKVIMLTIIVGMGAMILIMGDSMATLMPTIGDISLLPPEQQQIARGAALAVLNAGMVLTMLMFVFPVVMADTVPLDSAQHMDELLDSLPATPAVYLAGKMAGMWLAGISAGIVAMVVVALMWYLRGGSYNVLPYVDTWLVVGLPLIVLKGGLAVLIGATQPSRRRAGLAVIGAFIATFLMFGARASQFVSTYLNPVPYGVLIENLNNTFAALGRVPVSLPPSNLTVPAVMQAWLAGVLQLAVVWLAVWWWYRPRKSGASKNDIRN